MHLNPEEYYTRTIEDNKILLHKIKQRLVLLSSIRLLTFIMSVAIVYLFWSNNLVVSLAFCAGIIGFLILVSIYSNTKSKFNYTKCVILKNEIELKALSGDVSSFNDGSQYIGENHHFNQDIDLFGQGSFFQLINRTETKNGEQFLATILNSNDISSIQQKQNSIKELAQEVNWRQHFQVSASLINNSKSHDEILNWLKGYVKTIPNYLRFLPIIFSSLSLLIITGYATDIISSSVLLLWFFIGIGITGFFVKKVTFLFNSISKAKSTFSQYADILESLENKSFQSELLNQEQKKTHTNGIAASESLRKLSSLIDQLGQRNNILLSPITNGFLLWDIHFAIKIEHWITSYDTAIQNWFDAIEFFDAYNSLANYAFNHPGYTYAVLANDKDTLLNAIAIGHPMLKSDFVITNDIALKKDDFFIITGANMAGKSTFLRTIALNLVMSNCGLPVNASKFNYSPIKLISSMRTSDSLQKDESYFFSELKRLKFIVDEIEQDNYFIILDEILKGTNSKDKAEGSQKFIEKLVSTQSSGLIATHDLSLCVLADTYPEIHNYYFDAEIVNDELYFDYTFKSGICQNMNASFLLKKMKII